MIKRGHKGEEVKDIQRKLRQAGFLNFPTDTGFVGDITDKAIRDYQESRGIKVDGVVGERTKDMLDNEAIISHILKSPHLQGTPQQSTLKEMYRTGHHGLNLLTKGQVVSPEDLEYHLNKLDNKLMNKK